MDQRQGAAEKTGKQKFFIIIRQLKHNYFLVYK